MKYERGWARQESSRRRLDGLHQLYQVVFAGVKSRFDRIYTPSCEKNGQKIYAILHFRGRISS